MENLLMFDQLFCRTTETANEAMTIEEPQQNVVPFSDQNISTIMELFTIPRAEAISLLSQFEGNIELILNTLLS